MRAIIKLLDLLSVLADGVFWVCVAIILFCVVGFGLIMALAFAISAFLATL